MTIWKYEVKPDEFSVWMPEGAKVLTVQTQGKTAQMWALVNPDNRAKERKFVTFGTGHEIDNRLDLVYIGTFQAGWLVFHLFEILPDVPRLEVA